MTPQLKARDYTYRIHWSRDEHGYIATVAEFPTTQSSPADTPHTAIDALMTLVAQKLHELDLEGQPAPPAFAMSGRRHRDVSSIRSNAHDSQHNPSRP